MLAAMTIRPESLLCPRPEGLYCPPGDFFIDPTRAVERAVITHGHSDHARSGHALALATHATLDIMAERYGEGFAGRAQPLTYGEVLSRDGVEVSLVPAGHVLGSAQVVVRWKGVTIVVSGDYKRRRDPTCKPFQPVPCDVFVSEATFALPVFRHPPDTEEIGKLLKSVRLFPERTHLVGAYVLGKAQRIICLLREAGYLKPIYVHGALERLNALYEAHGVKLGPLAPATADGIGDLAGEIVIAPPSATQDRWARRFADPVDSVRVGLDAGQGPRPPAGNRAAARPLRPRRLGRADRNRSRASPGRALDHPRPRRGPRTLGGPERYRGPTVVARGLRGRGCLSVVWRRVEDR